MNKPDPRAIPPIGDWMTRMRAALFEAVTEDDIREIVAAQVKKAKAGDMAAVRLILGYVTGGQTINVKNAVITPNTAQLPAPPTYSHPGSSDRVISMQARADRGLPVFDPRDADHETATRRNGAKGGGNG